MTAKCHEYASNVFSCIMKVGSNIGPAAARSARPVPTPLHLEYIAHEHNMDHCHVLHGFWGDLITTHTHSHQGDTYFTVHVTPQTECSWVSFETNLEKESYSTLISKVLSLFRPGKCVVSLFASKVSKHTQVVTSSPLLLACTIIIIVSMYVFVDVNQWLWPTA